jgi:hypothetical protein
VATSSGLRILEGGAVTQQPLTADPGEFQTACVEAFVASWRARGFSQVLDVPFRDDRPVMCGDDGAVCGVGVAAGWSSASG